MSQSKRVIAVMKDGVWRTLRQIEQRIFDTFGECDTQPAISARLREGAKLSAAGYRKESMLEMVGNKQVWRYRLARNES